MYTILFPPPSPMYIFNCFQSYSLPNSWFSLLFAILLLASVSCHARNVALAAASWSDSCASCLLSSSISYSHMSVLDLQQQDPLAIDRVP